MENQTPFDLNQQVRTWRENLGQSPAFRRENLDELEVHLRDSIARLETHGLSAEESFLIATKRMGTTGVLATEFGKVNRQAVWIDRIFWMLVGLQVWGMVDRFLNQVAITSMKALFHGSYGSNYYNATIIAPTIYATANLVSMAGSLGLCWWLVTRQGPVFTQWVNRSSQRGIVLMVTSLFVSAFVLDNLSLIYDFSMPFFDEAKHPAHALQRSFTFSTLLSMICRSATLLTVTIILARKRPKPIKA